MRERERELERAVDEAYVELERSDLRSFQLVTVHGPETGSVTDADLCECVHTWRNAIGGDPDTERMSDTQRALGYLFASVAEAENTPPQQLLEAIITAAREVDSVNWLYREEYDS